ncbi:hypothetical protein C7A07_12595 [Pseudomonas fragi]|nr:hypothetical protein [Pseudomonas fragi]PRW98185.1 hypothetical protein C7A07_12595 [Pseudomonas fragi]
MGLAAALRRALLAHHAGDGHSRLIPLNFLLWERACSRCRRRGLSASARRWHREQVRSHRSRQMVL